MPHGDQVTSSIGIAEGSLDHVGGWRRLYSRADSALYEAKRGGRNRFCHAGEISADHPHRRLSDAPGAATSAAA